MSVETAAGGGGGYPLRYEGEYPEQLNRWLVLVKWLLVIPHLLIVGALVTVAYVITVISFFAILFTTRYPRDLFDFVVNIYRWNATRRPTSTCSGMNTRRFPGSQDNIPLRMKWTTRSSSTAGCR